MPEMPDPGVHFEMSNVLQSLADYQLKRETTVGRLIITTQRSLEKINELCNLAMEHRYTLVECGFLEPMQIILSQLIETICDGIEIHSSDAGHMIEAMKEIKDLVEGVVEHEQR